MAIILSRKSTESRRSKYGREDQRDDRAFRSSHLLATRIFTLGNSRRKRAKRLGEFEL
jgi:hypothetical protein